MIVPYVYSGFPLAYALPKRVVFVLTLSKIENCFFNFLPLPISPPLRAIPFIALSATASQSSGSSGILKGEGTDSFDSFFPLFLFSTKTLRSPISDLDFRRFRLSCFFDIATFFPSSRVWVRDCLSFSIRLDFPFRFATMFKRFISSSIESTSS